MPRGFCYSSVVETYGCIEHDVAIQYAIAAPESAPKTVPPKGALLDSLVFAEGDRRDDYLLIDSLENG